VFTFSYYNNVLPGFLPTLEELKGFLKDSRTSEDTWVPLKNTSARSILKGTVSLRKIKSNTTLSTSSNGENIEDIPMDSGASGRRIMNSMFASENSLEVRGGTDITLDALAAYLRYLEGTGNASWKEYVSPTNFVLQSNSCQGLALNYKDYISTVCFHLNLEMLPKFQWSTTNSFFFHFIHIIWSLILYEFLEFS